MENRRNRGGYNDPLLSVENGRSDDKECEDPLVQARDDFFDRFHCGWNRHDYVLETSPPVAGDVKILSRGDFLIPFSSIYLF